MASAVLPMLLALATACLSVCEQPAPIPCEDRLRELRAAIAAAELDPARLAQVMALESKGFARCKADDEKRADDYFARAMAIIDQ